METDKNEWSLLDSNFDKIAILPSAASHFKLILNEPGSGALTIPMLSNSASLVTSGMFATAAYRGSPRGGISIDNIKKDYVSEGNEDGGQWMDLSGSGELILLEDAIVLGSGDGTISTRNFTGTKAGILITLIEEAKARTGCLTNVIYDFTSVLDSDGNSWTDNEPYSVNIGTNLLEVLRQIAKFGIDFSMVLVGSEFVLSAYHDGIGTDLSSTIFFRVGENCEIANSDERGGDLKNALLLAYQNGYLQIKDDTSISSYRRREKYVDAKNAQSASSVSTYGSAVLQTSKNPKRGITIKVYDGVDPKVFIDYGMGCTVSVDVYGVIESHRILGIQCNWDGVDYSDVVLELNSLITENEFQMAQDIDWLLNQWATAHDSNLLEVAYWAAIGSGNDVVTQVNVMKLNERDLWVGGTFDKIGNIDTPVAGIAIYNLDTGIWSAPPETPFSHQDVSDFCFIGSDVYVSNNGSNLFRYSAGAWSLVLSTPALTRIRCMATDGTYLYFGGDFNQATNTESGTVTVNYVAKLDPSTNIITALDTGLGFEVFCLLWSGSTLYAGGSFTEKVMSWNGSAWSSMDGGLDGTVLTLVEYGTSILAGGEFTDHIAEWNGSSWATFGGGVGDNVRGIGIFLTDVYAVGDFTDVGNHIARFSGGYWSTLTTGLNNDAYTIVLDNNNAYVGGIFTTAGDKPAKMAAAYFNTFEALISYLENSSNNFDMGVAIHNAPASAITDNDEIPFWEDVAKKLRKITWANIKATLFPPSGADRILLTDSTGQPTTDDAIYWDVTNHNVVLGGTGGVPTAGLGTNVLMNLLAKADDTQVLQTHWTWGDSLLTFPALLGYRSRGTKASPTAVQAGDRLFGFSALGHDGTNWVGSVARMLLKATENWTGSAHGAGIYFEGTANGSTTRIDIADITSLGVNIPTGENYMVNGAPISGMSTGTAGQLIKWGPAGNTLVDSGIIPNIMAGKTLTLTAVDNYTLTIPATGTAALLGTANVFTATQLISVPTTTLTALQLKTTDNNAAQDLLQTLDSVGAITTLINEKGQVHIGGDVTSYTTYPFTVVAALPGILLKQLTPGNTNPYFRFINTAGKDCDIVKEDTAAVGFLFYGDSIGSFGLISALNGFRVMPFTTVNNAIKETLRLSPTVSTGGTGGAAGFGPGLTFYGETATDGTSQLMAQIAAPWTDPTNATRKAKMRFSVYDTAERIGIEILANGTTPDINLLGDTWFVGAGTGLPFGSCWGNEVNQTISGAVQNTWNTVTDTDMSNGQLNLVTHDGSGKLTVFIAGMYLVHWSLVLETNTSSKHIEGGISVSGTVVNDGQAHYESAAVPNLETCISSVAILSLAANATVELAVRTTDTGTPDILIDDVNLAITQIGA